MCLHEITDRQEIAAKGGKNAGSGRRIVVLPEQIPFLSRQTFESLFDSLCEQRSVAIGRRQDFLVRRFPIYQDASHSASAKTQRRRLRVLRISGDSGLVAPRRKFGILHGLAIIAVHDPRQSTSNEGIGLVGIQLDCLAKIAAMQPARHDLVKKYAQPRC